MNYEVISLGAFTLTDFDQHANKVKGNFVEFYALPRSPGRVRVAALPTDERQLLHADQLHRSDPLGRTLGPPHPTMRGPAAMPALSLLADR